MRAPDVWESAASRSIFLASSFSCSQAGSTLRPHAGNANRWAFPSEMFMKYLVTFITLSLLVSCTSIPNSTPKTTSTPVIANQTETKITTPIPITPTPTSPFVLPTVINTPHMIPTEIGRTTSQESFQLYDQRVEAFENTLQFDIKVSNIKINNFENISFYSGIVEGRLTNISSNPIVLRKNLSSGFTGNEDISWKFYFDNTKLSYINCCVDTFGILFLSQEDYVLLQPGEFQNYNLSFTFLPLEIYDDKGNEVRLSGKKIVLVATYRNIRVGYDEGPPFDSTKNIDMNSWVGEVQSNSVNYVFP